jgi:hypothetical protein
MTNEDFYNKVKGLRDKADRWDKLVKLAGYVGNASDVTIKMFQDDATLTYHIVVGKESNYGSSFEEALSKFEVEDD